MRDCLQIESWCQQADSVIRLTFNVQGLVPLLSGWQQDLHTCRRKRDKILEGMKHVSALE